MQSDRKGVRVDELRRLVENQHKREASCIFVPFWMLGCILTVLAGWLHSAPDQAAAAETPVSRWILAGADPSPETSSTSPVYSASDVPAWAQSTLLPLLMPSDDGTTAVNQFLLLGGIRVSQWRLPAASCPSSVPNSLLQSLGLSQDGAGGSSASICMGQGVAGVYTGTDDPSAFLDGRWTEGGSATGASFVTATPPCDAAAVQAGLRRRNVNASSVQQRLTVKAAACTCASAGSSAAVPVMYRSGFHTILPVSLGPTLASILLDTSSEAGAFDAVDASTQGHPGYVRVQAAGINAGSARWLAVAWDFIFSSTGSVRVKAMAGSLPSQDPAQQMFDLYGLLDAVAVLMAVSLFVQGALGFTKTARDCHQWYSQTGPRQPANNRSNPWSPSAWMGWVLDLTTAIYIAMAIRSWMQLTAQFDNLSTSSSANAAALTSASSLPVSTSPCYAEAASSDPVLATMQLHAVLNDALTLQSRWRFQCGIAAALLIVKILRLLSLQPRVGIFLEAIKEGLGELSHFGLIFITLLLGHSLWAGLAFGAQDAAFTTIPDGLSALLRMAMFDYDLAPLMNQDTVGASLFYASFMLIVTHISLWTWLGIALETFSLVRNASKERSGVPDLLTDVRSGVLHLPVRATELAQAIRSIVPGALDGSTSSARQRLDDDASGGAAHPVYRDQMLAYHVRVLQVLAEHDKDHITIEALAVTMHVSVDAAKAVLELYFHGDDVSQPARQRFASALLDSLPPRGRSKSVVADAGTADSSSHSSAVAFSPASVVAAHRPADEWQSGNSGNVPPLLLEVAPEHQPGVPSGAVATVLQPAPSPGDSPTPLPTSPLGLHHEGKYVSVRGMMVRRPSKGGGTGLEDSR